MNDADFAAIERTLDIILPKFYRYYLAASGDDSRIVKLIEYDELIDNSNSLVAVNQFVRISPDEWLCTGNPWPLQYFIIGRWPSNFQGEDFWAIDVQDTAPNVWGYDYEHGRFDLAFHSFDQFIESRSDYYAMDA